MCESSAGFHLFLIFPGLLFSFGVSQDIIDTNASSEHIDIFSYPEHNPLLYERQDFSSHPSFFNGLTNYVRRAEIVDYKVVDANFYHFYYRNVSYAENYVFEYAYNISLLQV